MSAIDFLCELIQTCMQFIFWFFPEREKFTSRIQWNGITTKIKNALTKRNTVYRKWIKVFRPARRIEYAWVSFRVTYMVRESEKGINYQNLGKNLTPSGIQKFAWFFPKSHSNKSFLKCQFIFFLRNW